MGRQAISSRAWASSRALEDHYPSQTSTQTRLWCLM